MEYGKITARSCTNKTRAHSWEVTQCKRSEQKMSCLPVRFRPFADYEPISFGSRTRAHNFNNEYASLIGLASGIAARSSADEVKAALSKITDLLHNFAGVHRALQPTYNTTIVTPRSTFVHFANRSSGRGWTDEELSWCSPNEHFGYTQSNAGLGTIVSELITNSARHAFGDRRGAIRIELSSFGPIGDASLHGQWVVKTLIHSRSRIKDH